GVTFFDKNGHSVLSNGRSLANITSIDWSTLDPRIKECKFIIATDVNNPLCGINGASYVYGPQKGATHSDIEFLDNALKCFADLIEETLNVKYQYKSGAGAAGGLGIALLLLNGKLEI